VAKRRARKILDLSDFRPEREGRNPASGEKIKIDASRKLTYLPAKAVRDLLNG